MSTFKDDYNDDKLAKGCPIEHAEPVEDSLDNSEGVVIDTHKKPEKEEDWDGIANHDIETLSQRIVSLEMKVGEKGWDQNEDTYTHKPKDSAVPDYNEDLIKNTKDVFIQHGNAELETIVKNATMFAEGDTHSQALVNLSRAIQVLSRRVLGSDVDPVDGDETNNFEGSWKNTEVVSREMVTGSEKEDNIPDPDNYTMEDEHLVETTENQDVTHPKNYDTKDTNQEAIAKLDWYLRILEDTVTNYNARNDIRSSNIESRVTRNEEVILEHDDEIFGPRDPETGEPLRDEDGDLVDRGGQKIPYPDSLTLSDVLSAFPVIHLTSLENGYEGSGWPETFSELHADKTVGIIPTERFVRANVKMYSPGVFTACTVHLVATYDGQDYIIGTEYFIYGKSGEKGHGYYPFYDFTVSGVLDLASEQDMTQVDFKMICYTGDGVSETPFSGSMVRAKWEIMVHGLGNTSDSSATPSGGLPNVPPEDGGGEEEEEESGVGGGVNTNEWVQLTNAGDWTVPGEGDLILEAIVVGGGQGGQYRVAEPNRAGFTPVVPGGDGGSSGEIRHVYIETTGGSTISYSCGAGGVGGLISSGVQGQPGDDTLFGNIVAFGGGKAEDYDFQVIGGTGYKQAGSNQGTAATPAIGGASLHGALGTFNALGGAPGGYVGVRAPVTKLKPADFGKGGNGAHNTDATDGTKGGGGGGAHGNVFSGGSGGNGIIYVRPVGGSSGGSSGGGSSLGVIATGGGVVNTASSDIKDITTLTEGYLLLNIHGSLDTGAVVLPSASVIVNLNNNEVEVSYNTSDVAGNVSNGHSSLTLTEDQNDTLFSLSDGTTLRTVGLTRSAGGMLTLNGDTNLEISCNYMIFGAGGSGGSGVNGTKGAGILASNISPLTVPKEDNAILQITLKTYETSSQLSHICDITIDSSDDTYAFNQVKSEGAAPTAGEGTLAGIINMGQHAMQISGTDYLFYYLGTSKSGTYKYVWL